LGGSHWHLVTGRTNGQVPVVRAERAKATFVAIHQAICAGVVRSCHDLSEGGLAAAAAEMCFSGGLGARIDVSRVPQDPASFEPAHVCFSESNSRFLCEVTPENADAFASTLADVPHARIGEVSESTRLNLSYDDSTLIDLATDVLKEAWQVLFRW
jgi:phosphoribosylformylglycinamidine synthase